MTKYTAKTADVNGLIHFTEEENETWHILISRQQEVIKQRACQEFIDGLEKLNLPTDHVPQCQEVSAVLQRTTGWSVQPVAALIPIEEFFSLLANKKFPAATFIRTREDLDYLQEPDIFHEYFGHCPLITHQTYADFLQWYGKFALSTDAHSRALLARLFWFTIEFGLIKNLDAMRIYGGGILSSKAESIYALDSEKPKHKPLLVLDAMRTPYRYDVIQPIYFFIESFADLYQLMQLDLLDYIQQATIAGEFVPEFITC